MKPDIKFFTLEEVKKLTLEILASGFFNRYFSTRQLADRIIVNVYNIDERYLFTTNEYSDLQLFLKKQMNHCIREFKKFGYIERYSNRFWIFYPEKIKGDDRLNE